MWTSEFTNSYWGSSLADAIALMLLMTSFKDVSDTWEHFGQIVYFKEYTVPVLNCEVMLCLAFPALL